MFLDTFRQNSLDRPDKLAIEFVHADPDQTEWFTFGELEEMVQRSMSLLRRQGVAAGDRVALQLPKSLPFIYLHLATMRLGAISLPLNPGYPPRELTYFLEDAGAKLFFGDAADQERITPILDRCSDLQARFWLTGAVADFREMVAGLSLDGLPEPPQ